MTICSSVLLCWQSSYSSKVMKPIKKYIFIWLHWVLVAACGDIVPWPRIKPGPPALGMCSLNHWTTREVPRDHFWLVDAPALRIMYANGNNLGLKEMKVTEIWVHMCAHICMCAHLSIPSAITTKWREGKDGHAVWALTMFWPLLLCWPKKYGFFIWY